MLVLTRRKDQKVLFPHLGISVEVVDVSGKSVRLGIDAPRNVRIVRSELEFFDEAPPLRDRVAMSSRDNICRHLDAANLALQLAKNQLRQGLGARADDALDQALGCLQLVDQLIADRADADQLAVHEKRTGYRTTRNPAGLVFDGSRCQRDRIVKHLRQQGIDNVESMESSAVTSWLLENELPNFALMICDPHFQPERTLDEINGCAGNLHMNPVLVHPAGQFAVEWSTPGFSICHLTT